MFNQGNENFFKNKNEDSPEKIKSTKNIAGSLSLSESQLKNNTDSDNEYQNIEKNIINENLENEGGQIYHTNNNDEINVISNNSQKGDFIKSATFKSLSIIDNEESNKYNEYSNMKSNFSSNTNFFESKLNFQKNQKTQNNDESMNGEKDEQKYKSNNISIKKKSEIKTTSDNMDSNIEEEDMLSNRNHSTNNKFYEQSSSNRNFRKHQSEEENAKDIYEDSIGTMNFSSNRKFQGSSDQYRQNPYSENASYRTFTEYNIEDLKNKLHTLQQNKLISVTDIGQGQLVIKMNNCGESLKNSRKNFSNETDENRKSITSNNNFQQKSLNRKYSKESSKQINRTNIEDYKRTTKPEIKASFSSKRQTKNSIALITDGSDEKQSQKIVADSFKSRKSIDLQKQNIELLEKLSKINKEKKYLEQKINQQREKQTFDKKIGKDTRSIEGIKKYEEEILTEIENQEYMPVTLPITSDPFGELVDDIIRNSMTKFKKKHCNICSRLLNKGKTSKQCQSYHHKI